MLDRISRPRCASHRYVHLQNDGTCFLCIGLELGAIEHDPKGRKRKPKIDQFAEAAASSAEERELSRLVSDLE